MWKRLWALALWGTFALWADVCDGLPTGPATDSGVRFWPPKTRVPPPRSYRLSVKDGGPAFRITVTVLPIPPDLRQVVHAGDIEVARCRDGKRLESLPFMAWQQITFGDTFEAVDINFDGYLDFSVVTDYASKWSSRSYWIYDPSSGRFVQNELTRELGENCLGAEWHGGCWKASHIDFDQNKREIRTYYILSFAVCPISSTDYSGDRYLVKDNRLILIHKEEVTSDNCKVTYSDLIGGTMRVTEVRRFDAQGQPVN